MKCVHRKLPITLSIAMLAGCAQLPEAVNGWIDIPLREGTFAESTVTYKSGTYEIPVYAYQALEYKLGILEGDTVTYEWSTGMQNPELLEVEFHGHTDRVVEEPGLLMFYKIYRLPLVAYMAGT